MHKKKDKFFRQLIFFCLAMVVYELCYYSSQSLIQYHNHSFLIFILCNILCCLPEPTIVCRNNSFMHAMIVLQKIIQKTTKRGV